MSDAKAWREAGYYTLFRDVRHGFEGKVVILVRKADGEARMAPVDRGRWMDRRAFSDFSETDLVAEDHDAMEACYCSPLTLCDFCAGRRPAPAGGPRHCAGCGLSYADGYGGPGCPRCAKRKADWEEANGVSLGEVQRWTDGEEEEAP